MIVFEVDYGAITSNKEFSFSTSASEFNRPKTDYNRCGQAQEDLLHIGSKARRFYKKWDEFHLKNLTETQYAEMKQDLEVLKNQYNYIEKSADYGNYYIPFSAIKELSMKSLKKVS
jgi:hypothetical protein